MKEKTFTVIDPAGMHARPATLLTKVANTYAGKVKIKYGDNESNMKSIMNIMALGIKQGSSFTVLVEGEDCDCLFDTLTTVLVENKIINA